MPSFLITRRMIPRWLLWFALVVVSSSSSTPSSNYNPYRYDLTVPQFTPDGRLLQVEYAQSAADHSAPIVGAYIAKDLVLLACWGTRSSISSQQGRRQSHDIDRQQHRQGDNNHRNPSHAPTTTNNEEDVATNSIPSLQQPIQSRLIVLPNLSLFSDADEYDNDDYYEQDESLQSKATNMNIRNNQGAIVVALAGVRADCLALLQAVQEQLFEYHRIYAGTKIITPSSIASILASTCHRYAMGGGVRPFGATTWVTGPLLHNWVGTTAQKSERYVVENNSNNDGVDDNNNNNGDVDDNNNIGFVLHQTDPSGAIRDIVLSTQQNVVVLGGRSVGAQQLQQRLEQEWGINTVVGKDSVDLIVDEQPQPQKQQQQRKRIAHLLSIMVDEYRRQNSQTDNSDDIDTFPDSIEVMLMSPTRGVVSLTPHQVESLLLEQQQHNSNVASSS